MHKRIIYAVSIVIVMCLMCGCGQFQSPPDINAAIEYFKENQEDLQLVKDFLLEQNDVYIICDRIKIDNWKGTSLSDEVCAAIKRLRNDQTQILIIKQDNTIMISMFFPEVREISSGFAYSINGVDTPHVAYAIEMTPISDIGWYYYVEDFNTWRAEQKKGQGTTEPSPCPT